jgi:hypothetical protein
MVIEFGGREVLPNTSRKTSRPQKQFKIQNTKIERQKNKKVSFRVEIFGG